MKYTPQVMKIGAGCLIATLIALYVWHISVRPAVFELYVFDTPGAPSLFVRTEEDRRILIHGGANSDIVRRITDLLPFYSRHIDTIVALDDDPKHITGLIEVLGRYEVGSVLLGNATSSDPTFKVMMGRIAEKGIATSSVAAGDNIVSMPLTVFDLKRSVFTFTMQNQTVLIIPFNQGSLSKKVVDVTHPKYVIYSAAPTPKSSKSKSQPKSDLLAGIMADHRFNIRSTGEVRLRIDNKKGPRGPNLSIEEI